jgi:hypothetical protein
VSETWDVCVIGAGFAGLSTAHLLAKAGRSVVVVDKGHRLGEKTRTETFDGHVTELGTCYASYDYTEIFSLAQELGIKRSLYDQTNSCSPDAIAAPLFPNAATGTSMFETESHLTSDYCQKRDDLLRRYAAGDAEAMQDLALPCTEWLVQNGYEQLIPVFSILGDGFGYGPIDQVPALYLIRFISAGAFQSLATKSYWRLEPFESILTELARTLTVKSNAPVSGGTFDADAEIWCIHAAQGDIPAKRVVVACPPLTPEITSLMDPARQISLQGKLSSTPYAVAAVTVDNWFNTQTRSTLRQVGGLDQICFASRTGPLGGGKANYNCYVMLSDKDVDVEKIIRAEVTGDGGDMAQINSINIYPNYNTHFTTQALLEGHQHAFHRAQGRKNLWIVSSIIAQENWRDLYTLSGQVADMIDKSLHSNVS